MDEFMPAFVKVEREAVLDEIEAAFGDVVRGGGVSWSEAGVIDDYGSDRERMAARAQDVEGSWQSLLDSGWNPESGGGFSFLDATGFRYYLPAAMTLSVRQGDDSGILFHLTLGNGVEDRRRWSLLTSHQRRCVLRYLEYMYVVALSRSPHDAAEYLKAIESHRSNAAETGDEPQTSKPSAPRPKRKKQTKGW